MLTARIRHLPALLGLLLLAAPALAQVNVTLDVDDAQLQGTHPAGTLLLYTPDPVSPGSSVSHWDTSATPDLLMEPFLTPGLPFLGLDVTPGQMQDMLWSPGTSNVNIIPLDPPGTGFTDPRPFAGAPGNPATTLGEARINLFNAVLGAWVNTLGSTVDIDVMVIWAPLFCDPSQGAALAGALSQTAFVLEGPDLPPHLFQAALAESLIGEDLNGPADPADVFTGDILVFMNSAIDDECLGPGTSWYYGLDGNNPPDQLDQAPTVLHELGHGLGFATYTDDVTGEQFAGFPSFYDFWTFDQDQGRFWNEMTDAQRVESAVNFRDLTWEGPSANAMAAMTLDGGVPGLTVNSPASIAGTYPAEPAAFGPGIPAGGLSGDVACLLDGVPDATSLNGCTPATNPGELAGKVALIDRGDCTFTTKVANAQAAGAIGAIVVNNAGSTIFAMGGDDPTITIPAVMVGNGDGREIRQAACGETAGYFQGERFQASATWSTAADSGEGQAVMLTSESGYFWFFGPENVEVTVKVLDACNLPGFGNFWVFAAGMTDVGVTLTVTDTLFGVSRVYNNVLGTGFDPIRDTSAFATCP